MTIDNVRVRRDFVDTPAGQLHVRRSGVVQHGQVPVLLLHPSPASSLAYVDLLPLLGTQRLAIAVDTPGFGESFRPSSAPTIADYARWIATVPEALGFERFDVMGMFTGAGTAVDMAVQFPDNVRRLVLAGPPVFTPEQQAGFVANAWPTRPRPDGSHLMIEWQRVMSRPMPGVSFERRFDGFNEFYRGGVNAIWGEQAIAEYPTAETLPRVTQQVLILAPEGISGDSHRAATLTPRGRLEPINHSGYSMMSEIPDVIAAKINSFLDEPDP